ncbi:MAG: hypothetical protein ACLPY5_12105 [Candidatus Bathyarchaeia archaeon]
MSWLHELPGWETATPESLLAFQEKARGRERYVLLDLIEDHTQQRGGTYMSMIVRLSRLRNFFLHNRVEIPPAKDWTPKPTKEPTRGHLTVSQVKEIIVHSGLRDAAIFLTMFQGLLDLERFSQFNAKYAGPLVKHLKESGVDEPFRIDFPTGRKKNRNLYYTFIHHDALEAWRQYFERVRGWPKPDEVLALQRNRMTAPSKTGIRTIFARTAQKLKIREPRQSDRTHRTGVAPHEAFRDVVRSLLQTARKDGFDPTCVEFWMGHSIDPYNYNKFAELEPEYVLENARIAAKYLNLITAGHDKELRTVAKKNEQLQGRVDELELAVRMLQDASNLKVRTAKNES